MSLAWKLLRGSSASVRKSWELTGKKKTIITKVTLVEACNSHLFITSQDLIPIKVDVGSFVRMLMRSSVG